MRLTKALARRVEVGSVALWDRYVLRVPSRSTQPYASHLPVLLVLPRLMRVTSVVEFGAGLHSTLTFLDRTAYPNLERLFSYENDPHWANRVSESASSDPRYSARCVEGPMAEAARTAPLDSVDVIFIDDSSTEAGRCRTIESVARRRPSAVVVVHDFEVPSYRRAARLFRHKYRFGSVNPNVGVAWNDRYRLGASMLRAFDHRLRLLRRDLTPLGREETMALLFENMKESRP